MNTSLKKLDTIYQIKSKGFVLEFFSVRLFSKEIQFGNDKWQKWFCELVPDSFSG